MMHASHYMSEWTSVLSLCEMPIRSGVCAKSHAGREFVVVRVCGLFKRDNQCWRSEDRRYEGQGKRQVNGARLKAAATNSTATSDSEATSTLGRFRASNFGVLFCERHFTEVKNEKLQH
jgi:hypothetical protein